jgi:hypothetical protein
MITKEQTQMKKTIKENNQKPGLYIKVSSAKSKGGYGIYYVIGLVLAGAAPKQLRDTKQQLVLYKTNRVHMGSTEKCEYAMELVDMITYAKSEAKSLKVKYQGVYM